MPRAVLVAWWKSTPAKAAWCCAGRGAPSRWFCIPGWFRSRIMATADLIRGPSTKFAIPENLPEEDGVPMETFWHRSEIQVLIESVAVLRRGRKDYVAAGNTFIYYTPEQWTGSTT